MLWAARRRMGILRPGVDSHARNDHPHRHQRTFETRQHSEGNAIQSRVSASHPVCKEGPVPPIRSARGRPIPTALRYDGSGWPEVERSLTWLFYLWLARGGKVINMALLPTRPNLVCGFLCGRQTSAGID